MMIGLSKKHVIQLHWNQVTHINLREEFIVKCSILTNAKMMKLRILKLMRT